MYMERIQPDLLGAKEWPEGVRRAAGLDSRPRATGARMAAGLGVITFAAILALPYWAAMALWLAVALLARAGVAMVRFGYEAVLFAGDLVLGQRKAPELLQEGR